MTETASRQRWNDMQAEHQRASAALETVQPGTDAYRIILEAVSASKPPELTPYGDHLAGADPDCRHHLDPWEWSGVRCIDCGGQDAY